jgi:hypothetical protein
MKNGKDEPQIDDVLVVGFALSKETSRGVCFDLSKKI